jgi:hypothetical protein
MTSAYPAPLETLIPQARELAAQLGQTPSRNKLMTQFKIGSKKANQILDALADADTSPARRLHAVPNTDQAQPEPAGSPVTEETRTVVSQGMDVTQPGRPAVLASPGEDARGASVTSAPSTVRAWRNWTRRLPASWPLILLALPAFVAIWSGWVGLGELTGFGPVHPLPGIADGFTLNTAITLPIGVETYAAYALRVWLAGVGSSQAQRFAKWSALGSLALGVAGQIAYHLMTAWHVIQAPWPITAAVACLPVIVLGLGAALAHLQHRTHTTTSTDDREVS